MKHVLRNAWLLGATALLVPARPADAARVPYPSELRALAVRMLDRGDGYAPYWTPRIDIEGTTLRYKPALPKSSPASATQDRASALLDLQIKIEMLRRIPAVAENPDEWKPVFYVIDGYMSWALWSLNLGGDFRERERRTRQASVRAFDEGLERFAQRRGLTIQRNEAVAIFLNNGFTITTSKPGAFVFLRLEWDWELDKLQGIDPVERMMQTSVDGKLYLYGYYYYRTELNGKRYVSPAPVDIQTVGTLIVAD